jgi:hypothetical protein
MMRRSLLAMASAGVVLAFALMGSQPKSKLLALDWASRATKEKAPAAVLIEMGLNDRQPTSWSGQATVQGARVVRREGYRFRDDDRLVDPDGWKASSYRPVRPVRRRPGARPVPGPLRPGTVAAAAARPASVGVVLQLTDVQPDATLTIEAGRDNPKTTIPLADVLAGQTKKLWDGAAAVRRVSSATAVAAGPTEDDFPAAAYGPDGTLWLAYISYALKDPNRQTTFTEIPEEPKTFEAYHKPEFSDQLLVKTYRDGRWSKALPLTGAHEDLVRCAVAVEGNGTAWVVYSAQRQGKCCLYARSIQGKGDTLTLGADQQLTFTRGPALTPALCTAQDGRVLLAYQSWNAGGPSQIALWTCHAGKWSPGPAPAPGGEGENCWHPAVAASADGKMAVAYDVYKDGDYDVHVALIDNGRVTDMPVADSRQFEARPSLAYDPQGRLWIAYEEGPEKWGKNYGALETDRGNPLYSVRSVRVACVVDGKLLKPTAELPTSLARENVQMNFQTVRYAYPRLGLDDKGRLWLTYRHKLPTPFGVMPGTNWVTFARRLDGDHWTEPIEISRSDGLLDSRPVLLPHSGGGLLVVTNTDGRYTTPDHLANRIYAGVVNLPGESAEPVLVAKDTGKRPSKEYADERAAVEQIRHYRVDTGNKKYRLLRGEFHRHTEISFDGGADGSLEDMFRYAIDAADLDWIGNTDHDNGAGREYSWWLTQKLTDAYHGAGALMPMFSYERSLPYPHGHRNVIFAKRGMMTLPRLAEAEPNRQVAGFHANDSKMLYRYLKELGGVCASHTSATVMGTDWRDNDPDVEPVVEIYQGDRNSYEKEGAPRAGYEEGSGKRPVNIGGWYPKGYINLAFDKGYRLGFQSSSDHISTHISYCVVLAETPGREQILEALRKRRCYAATDDIVLDVRSGGRLMGEAFKTESAPALDLVVLGTKPLSRVEVLKDSEVVATFKPGKAEYRGRRWLDPNPSRGVHYYYVRVQQEDGELAWSSPMWIDFAP